MKNRRSKFSNRVLFIITLIFVAALMFWIIYPMLTSALESAVKKEESRECLQWEKWSEEIKVFYLTPWQKEQCDAMGIKIDAPVKGGQKNAINKN